MPSGHEERIKEIKDEKKKLDSPLVVGYVCYHQNLLLLSAHVSHGCDGGFPDSAGLNL